MGHIWRALAERQELGSWLMELQGLAQALLERGCGEVCAGRVGDSAKLVGRPRFPLRLSGSADYGSPGVSSVSVVNMGTRLSADVLHR